ncbi:MAG: hypothetical protein A2506_10545 [Elusimicrobia bacterium RIFOXYD12_FULL_66_9]|nr:MAG: hypothetical protein A2506_10545 [Elusimicrobia bacterium RIFOXYD12_FULL_66_9]
MFEPLFVFGSFTLLGLFQAAPSVTTGDAGEFAAAAATLSVPHAPGYPLYVLIGKFLGNIVPLGNWSYRTNLLSVLAGASALALLCDALRRWGAGRPARLAAVLVLGLAPLWREQSAVTEVFTLHLLCASLLLWLVAAAEERLLSPGPAAALGLVFGLSLGDHQTMILVLPALLLAGRGRPGRLPRAFAFAALGALAGFAVHAVLPLRALKSPPLDWGHAVTPQAFWHLLARKDYGSLSLTVDGSQASGLEGLPAQGWRSLRVLALQLGPLGSVLGLLGAVLWRRAGLRLSAAGVWAWVLLAGPGFLMLGRPPFDPQTSNALARFSLLPLLGAGLFVAAGVEVLSHVRPSLAAAAALAAGALAWPAAARESRRDDLLAHDYGRTILKELPPGAALVMDGGDDTFYSLSFLRFAQGLRPDLEMWDRGGVVFRHPYGSDFRRRTKTEKEARRVGAESLLASSGRLWYSGLNAKLLPGWDLRPAGLLLRPVRPGQGVPESSALRETMPLPRAPGAARRHRDQGIAAFVLYQRALEASARGDDDAGLSWLELAQDAAGDVLWAAPIISYAYGVTGYEAVGRGDLKTAERAYRDWAAILPAKAEPLVNLSVVLERSRRLDEAEGVLRAAVRREPRGARAWAALGSLYWGLARWSDSAEAFSSAAALEPGEGLNAAWAAKARARLRAGR